MKSAKHHHIIMFLVCILGLAGCASSSGRMFVVPEKPSPKKHYLFYLHEANLEDLSPDNKLVQNYEKIVKLWMQLGFVVFSEHRDTVVIEVYAQKISSQVQQLLQRGVPAKRITVVGYSKGSLIAQAVAQQIENPSVNYVFLAGCSDTQPIANTSLQGRILSIIDGGDHLFHSCKKRLSNKRVGLEFKEIKLDSGLGHNLFRVPREKYVRLWQRPVKDWLTLADSAN